VDGGYWLHRPLSAEIQASDDPCNPTANASETITKQDFGLNCADRFHKKPDGAKDSSKRNNAGFSAGCSPMQHTCGSLREHQTETGSPTFNPYEAFLRVSVDHASMVSLRDL
jgi:hypothetical protein